MGWWELNLADILLTVLLLWLLYLFSNTRRIFKCSTILELGSVLLFGPTYLFSVFGHFYQWRVLDLFFFYFSLFEQSWNFSWNCCFEQGDPFTLLDSGYSGLLGVGFNGVDQLDPLASDSASAGQSFKSSRLPELVFYFFMLCAKMLEVIVWRQNKTKQKTTQQNPEKSVSGWKEYLSLWFIWIQMQFAIALSSVVDL